MRNVLDLGKNVVNVDGPYAAMLADCPPANIM